MRRRLRWRRATTGELETIAARLADWPANPSGAARHMFALSAIETHGADALKLAANDELWAVAVVFPGRLVVPCGDPEAIERAGSPTKRWRLMVGDLAAGDAVLANTSPDPGLIVHDQRFFTVDRERVPDEAELPDPGLRRAETADIPRLAELAVQLHVDDEFGPDPGRVGLRGYRQRLESTVPQGLVYCVGPAGAPILKLERSVSSHRWGVQLAGIVAAPEARREGLGRAAVAAAVRTALKEGTRERVVSLHVRAENTPAHAAYRAAGFVDREAWRLAVRS
jgi:ribosomal protein S18 acetylase RimI-like enzyme